MPIVGKFLQLSAYLFDHALTLNMNIASFLQKPNCTTADCATSPVEVVWKLIRDISGMFFIFILVWASIKMILGGSNSKSVIVGVVLAGLLVNFSLFATKLIIDASNSLTLTVYSAITPEYNPTIEQSLGYGTGEQNKQASGSISTKIMQVVKLQSLYASTRDSAKKANFNVTSIVSTVGGIVLMLVLALAFLAGGLMFLWRFVMLLVLMAFSPLPALALAFPQLQSKSKEFMKKLLDQCLFAPIFLFFIYIALKVMTDPAFIALANPSKNTFANVFAGGGAIGPLVQYGIMVTIIYTGLLAAKSYGGKGADFGINGINWLSKMGQGAIRGAAVGTAKFAGRNTYGLAASTLANSDMLKTAASRSTVAAMGLKGLRVAGSDYNKNIKTKSEARVQFAESLGYNKQTVTELDDRINTNLDAIDNYNKELADPNIDAGRKANIKILIDSRKEENKKFKAQIANEKLRRQSNVARIDDPTRDLRSGNRQGMSLLQRANRFGFISEEDAQSTAQLSIKNVEQAIKEKTESLDKMHKDREEIKKEIKDRTKLLKDRYSGSALTTALAGDVTLLEKNAELVEATAGKIDATTGKRAGGIIDAEADIRRLKSSLAKLK
jgi:hypothetical protein